MAPPTREAPRRRKSSRNRTMRGGSTTLRRRASSPRAPPPLLLLLVLLVAAAPAPRAAAAADDALRAPLPPPTPRAAARAGLRRGPPLAALPPGLGHDNVHTVFLTDCTPYSDWQTLALIFSWRQSRQPGPLSRVMCCTPREAASYSGAMLALVPTHVAPSLTKNPRNNDTYAAYNKPAAIIDWLAHKSPAQEYVLVLDSDMILRHPFLPGRFPMVRPGWAVSGKYDYMAGVENELADTFVPNVPPRDDLLAGPRGRRADQVGGFFFIRREDLRAVSTEWLSLSEAVRFDPTAWRTTGDAFAKTPGAKPWISEMYGYAFSAARHGVWHTWAPSAMLYPGYVPEGVPLLLHYGLQISVRIPDPSMDDKGLEALRLAAEADARGEVDDDGGDGRDELVSAARLAREVEAPGPEPPSLLEGGDSSSSSLSPPPRSYVWSWDKHTFTRHNVSRCPPWTLVLKHPPHGLFAQPPLPDMLDPSEEPIERYTNLIAVETVHTANAALCEWYLSQCPTTKGSWLRRRCARVRRGYEAVKKELRRWDARFACADFYRGCHAWALSGECDKNPKFMRYNCQPSCKVCTPLRSAPPPGEYMPIELVGVPSADGAEGPSAGASADGQGGGGGGKKGEAVIDPLAPGVSEQSAPGEGIHPERRIRREAHKAAKLEATARQVREAEARRAAAAAAAAAESRGWLARLLRPGGWRDSLAAAAAALDGVATGESAAGPGGAGGAGAGDRLAALDPAAAREVGGAPGQIPRRRAAALRAHYSSAPYTMSREDLLRHCHTWLLSAPMAELVECTDSARLGLMYLTADEREQEEERKQEEEQKRLRDEDEAKEVAAAKEAAAAAKGAGRGGSAQQHHQHEGRTAAALAAAAAVEEGDAAIPTDRGGRRPIPRQRDAVGRAPGSSSGRSSKASLEGEAEEDEEEAAADSAAAAAAASRGRRVRWAVALVVWLGALAVVLHVVPHMWRRASPAMRASIIRRVKSKA